MDIESRVVFAKGWEKKEDGECLLNGHRDFSGGDENVLELDRGDDCTSLRMH